MSTKTTCTDCGGPLGRRFTKPLDKNDHPCAGKDCDAHLCTDCHGRRPLLVPGNNQKEVPAHGVSYQDCEMKQFCQQCFEETSFLDFSSSYHQILAENSKITFVFVHGGSGSRQMFHYHALSLKDKYNHSSILLDLPGHGAMVKTPLTLDSSVEQVGKVLTECNILVKKDDGTYEKADANHKLIYVGGSLGAYIGFYVCNFYRQVLDGAVLMDCGQNTGPGCSLKAKLGLVLLNWLGKNMSNAKLLHLMLGETKKSKADYYLVETVLGAGMFFDQASAQVECLKTVAPAQYIPNLTFPILYMNGSEDYRDSENIWLDLCVDKEKSELKVYEGGDHFFIHDTRFVEDILTRMDAFAKKL
jgi:pimeloyl-ACP methyl ester carboxylesterase